MRECVCVREITNNRCVHVSWNERVQQCIDFVYYWKRLCGGAAAVITLCNFIAELLSVYRRLLELSSRRRVLVVFFFKLNFL